MHEPKSAAGLQKFSMGCVQNWSWCAGRKRLQRFLQGLRVTTAKAHYDLLLTMTAAQPTLAAAYLVNNSLSLEPRPSLRWWAGVSLVGSVIQQASQVPLPYAEQARR